MSWKRWVREIEVEPSLYAADFLALGEQIDHLMGAGARVFHFDVGDGHFVEPVTIGPIVLESIAPLIHRFEGVIDCHLMVDDPEHHFEMIKKAGDAYNAGRYQEANTLVQSLKANTYLAARDRESVSTLGDLLSKSGATGTAVASTGPAVTPKGRTPADMLVAGRDAGPACFAGAQCD